MAVAAVALLVAAAVLGYPELAVLGYAGLFALLAAGLWMLARPQLVARREIRPNRVTAGDEAVGVLTVTNQMNRRSPPVSVTESVDGRSVGVPVPSLAARESHLSGYPLPTDRRGVYQVGPLTVGHADPLRLMEVAKRFGEVSTLWVHPLVDTVYPLPTGRSQDQDGPTSSVAPQGGIAFHSLREYVPGDDWRLIHWKSSARTGQLMVRHNVVPNEPRLMIVLDTSVAAYDDESFEHAVRAAASLSVAALRAGFPLELRTTGGEVTVAEEDGPGRTSVLDLLAAVRLDPADRGLAALPALVPEQSAVSLGVVTGRPAQAELAVLPMIRPRFLMLSLVQFAATFQAETRLPGVVSVAATSPAEFALAWNELVRR
ncbi:hypothetical protein ACWT_2106 [Actinoplanes sp. SE50]|uniref:DUF58 domain-containing protein n=1 Tax=Actinoplanes sp. SE50 TaxID=2033844 RepID=UPI00023EC914|nr:DUF58 domain-containing protein [Actinoplanes sp. SE50]AEV83126.1 yeaD-like uncharacterized protein [Actinoplanes sp. SE50/110]ATO81521.1 hypothetical protein ACWT_2106 [Actinoplanes sp. SE50]SLL98928.1 hypothetical protein ACSP50_2155 [Actinoplanes sp. SE50/110]